jgi:O-antigen/teichoic acid export membrane protein
MISGAGSSILTTSKYYKIQSLFMIILVVMIIIFNFIFIPLYGIVGAAVATFLAKLIYNFIRYFYLRFKLDMHPYDYRFLLVAGISIFSFGVGYFIPSIRFEDNLFPYFDVIIDLCVRSSTILVLFMTLVLSLKISDDINSRYHVFKDITLRKVGFRS